MVKLDLNGVSVESVAKLVSDFTRTNFIVSEKAKGTRITIMSPKLIPISQMLKTFESALDANGLAMVPDGEIMKIVPKETAP
jgi:general secretion pathway protein D